MKLIKETGKRDGTVEKLFEPCGTLINKEKIHKHQIMKAKGITGKQYRRLVKQKRKETRDA